MFLLKFVICMMYAGRHKKNIDGGVIATIEITKQKIDSNLKFEKRDKKKFITWHLWIRTWLCSEYNIIDLWYPIFICSVALKEYP